MGGNKPLRVSKEPRDTVCYGEVAHFDDMKERLFEPALLCGAEKQGLRPPMVYFVTQRQRCRNDGSGAAGCGDGMADQIRIRKCNQLPAFRLHLGIEQPPFGHTPEVFANPNKIAYVKGFRDSQQHATHEVCKDICRGKGYRSGDQKPNKPNQPVPGVFGNRESKDHGQHAEKAQSQHDDLTRELALISHVAMAAEKQPVHAPKGQAKPDGERQGRQI